MLKFINAGLSRTGTTSLWNALTFLGFKAVHWEPHRIRDIVLGQTTVLDFRRYDDVDAVTDLPASLYYRELHEVYPGSKVILTTRDIDDWYESVKWHYETRVPRDLGGNATMLHEAAVTQRLAYGSEHVSEALYKRRFREFQDSVLEHFPDALVLDVAAGDGWEKLCPFVGCQIPRQPFPRSNTRSNSSSERPSVALQQALTQSRQLGSSGQ